MKYFSKEEVLSCPSIKMGMPVSTFLAVLNGNAEFILRLAKRQKQRFSLTSTAMYLALRYFARKSLFSEDRFLICGGCLILAHKIWNTDPRLLSLTGQFDNLVGLFEDKVNVLSVQKIDQIENALCVAESLLLRELQFDIEVRLPYEYLNPIIDHSKFPKERAYALFNQSRVIILDSYRTWVSLVYRPQEIAITAYLIACSNQQAPPFAESYQKWLADLSGILNLEIRGQNINDILATLNQLLTVNT